MTTSYPVKVLPLPPPLCAYLTLWYSRTSLNKMVPPSIIVPIMLRPPYPHLCWTVHTCTSQDVTEESFFITCICCRRPGVLVLVNDADWELSGQLDTVLEEKDNVVFISTLHGGWHCYYASRAAENSTLVELCSLIMSCTSQEWSVLNVWCQYKCTLITNPLSWQKENDINALRSIH